MECFNWATSFQTWIAEPRFIVRKFCLAELIGDGSKSIPGIFYHGIALDSYYGWYAKQVLASPGMLITPNYSAHLDPQYAKSHVGVRGYDIEKLKYEGHKLNFGGITPRAIEYIYQASRMRAGLPYEGNLDKTSIIEISDLELDFEEVRRIITPEAPSRLDCLFVADNIQFIKNIFRDGTKYYIMKVKIIGQLGFAKVDSKWLGEYEKSKDKKCIESYWTSKQFEME